MSEYTLTLRVPVHAVDDVAAREIAKAILSTVPDIAAISQAKLQKMQAGKPPRKVRLD
jgi:hypothetical protein